MITEQISEAVARIDQQKDNLQYLGGAIPALGRKLLFGGVNPQEEVQGYSYLRTFSQHPDNHIKRLAGDTLDKRWDRVGFYYRYTPSRRFPSFDDVKRPTFHELSRGISSLGDDTKVAILELARRFSEPEAKPLSTQQFGEVLTPLLGPQTDPKYILEKLKEYYLLTEEGEYVQLLQTERGRMRLGQSAQRVLAPHLPVLEAISYPEATIANEDLTIVEGVGKAVDRALKTGTSIFAGENATGLTITEDKRMFMPSLMWIEVELDEERRKYMTHLERDRIAFLDDEGKMYSITRTKPFRDIKESIRVTVTNQPFGAKRRLLLDFWGSLVRNGEVGGLSVDQGRSRKGFITIEATGVLKPDLPTDLQDADKISVSEEEVSLEYENVSGGERGIYAAVKFSTPFKESNPFLGRYNKTENHVSGTPSSITVPETSDYKPPRRRKKKEEEDSDFSLPHFRGPRTTWKEVKFDKPGETLDIKHPRGAYQLSYEVGVDSIQVTFTGRGWERIMEIPKNMDVVAIAQAMEAQVATLAGHIQQNKDVIQHQVQNSRRLTLAEQQVMRFVDRDMEDSDLREFAVRKFSETGIGILGPMNELDEELAKLDPRSQWIARAYMQSLGRWHYETYHGQDDELKVADEDPRVQMRFTLRKFNLSIPERILKLSEEVFLPKPELAPEDSGA